MGRLEAVTILPITYLGGTDYFAHLAAGARIDLGENWVKQTARNRCEILTSTGVAALTVPVHAGGGSKKIATREVRIDHSKRWAHVHWQSLVSAYRGAPFFDHYEERFAPVFCDRRHDFLVDLDLELLDVVVQILKLPAPEISETWVEAAPDDLDLRGKKALRRGNYELANASQADDLPYKSHTTSRSLKAYTQVFADRLPFQPGLSITDLIFNEGTDAKDHLLRADRQAPR